MQGQIRRLVRDKRFGFIRDEQGHDRFFHANNSLTPFEQLREGQQVTFDGFELNGVGLRADRVEVVNA
jgi:cold shock CspA family protein